MFYSVYQKRIIFITYLYYAYSVNIYAVYIRNAYIYNIRYYAFIAPSSNMHSFLLLGYSANYNQVIERMHRMIIQVTIAYKNNTCSILYGRHMFSEDVLYETVYTICDIYVLYILIISLYLNIALVIYPGHMYRDVWSERQIARYMGPT